jgi:hypothetical protein
VRIDHRTLTVTSIGCPDDSVRSAEGPTRLVSPTYDALTRPGEKDVAALIKSVTSSDFQSCRNEGDCADQGAVISRFKRLASTIPDLHWTIKELFVSGGIAPSDTFCLGDPL